MSSFDIQLITLVTDVVTLIALLIAVFSLWQARALSQTEFEDSLSAEYREIIHRIPVEALGGKKLARYKRAAALDDIYNYVDFTNEQLFLRSKGRISDPVWREWTFGIRSNMERPLFRDTWDEIKAMFPQDFAELKRFERSGYREDPKDW
ncbi:MAG: hypothetical protein ACM3ZT_03625 [Bacillota bacterium]